MSGSPPWLGDRLAARPQRVADALEQLHGPDLSIVKAGIQTFNAVLCDDSALGDYARDLFCSARQSSGEPARVRDLLPPPLPTTGKATEKLRAYFKDYRVPRDCRGDRGELRRLIGVGAWAHVQISFVSWLRAGEGLPERFLFPARAGPAGAQSVAIAMLEKKACDLVDRVGRDFALPRQTRAELVTRLNFYSNGDVASPERLALARIAPSLPDARLCGRLRAVDSCSAEIRDALLHPEQWVAPEEEWPKNSPGPRPLR